ncbi:transferase activity protein [[Candida] boidinii]|nr:transferase activity protein [[Candida] boidinii]OWB80059.1 transferase activity protein [[Candida] boidinii]
MLRSKSNISLDDFTNNNLGLINKISNDIKYTETELIKIKDELNNLCQFSYFSEVPVGFIISRPLISVNNNENNIPIGIIIENLSILTAYSIKFNIEIELINYIEKLTIDERHLNNLFFIINKKSSESNDNNDKLIKILNNLNFEIDDTILLNSFKNYQNYDNNDYIIYKKLLK